MITGLIVLQRKGKLQIMFAKFKKLDREMKERGGR